MRKVFNLLFVVIVGLSTYSWATASEQVLYTFTGGNDGGEPIRWTHF
jgi:hypothetical protein